MSDEKPFRIGDALRFGWEKFKGHFLFLWMLLGIVLITSIFFELAQKSAGRETWGGMLVGLAALGVNLILELGLIRMYLDLTKEKENSLDTLFSQYRLAWTYFGAFLLYGVAVLFGLILFIIPGIYLALKYQFFNYLIVDQRLGAIAALKKSGEMTAGYKWQLLAFSLVFWGINLLGALMLGIGLLVTIPVSIMAYTFVYRRLLMNSPRVALSSETEVLAKVTA